MRALTVKPGVKRSVALTSMPDPNPSEGPVLVRSLVIGLCGTDVEIVDAQLGQAPLGAERLVLGHESLGRVIASGDASLTPGDLVVGFVRRPDPVPCPACAVGEWDMCRNGQYTSRGITRLHGFAREWWRCEADELIRINPSLADLGVLVEPMSVVMKAWEQIERIGLRSYFKPRVAAITGAGTIGLLAALGGVQRGMDVHVFDLATSGPKPELVAALGAHYHSGPITGMTPPDIIIECTGAAQAIADVLMLGNPACITCLVGMSSKEASVPLDVSEFNQRTVRRNGIVFGSVNANRRHYEQAESQLTSADPKWLSRLLSRRVALDDFAEALNRRPADIKVIIDMA